MPEDAAQDTEDMKIAGCDVHLVFVQSNDTWTVVGTISSGTAENKHKETVTSGPWATRDLAEEHSLEEIANLLGNNVDRTTSPFDHSDNHIDVEPPSSHDSRGNEHAI